ncbi:hypothetical protein POKO110462_02700 [Pontibacter korlensis]|uniref:Uncharacterized protein n=1 Tax=Pontibacter korlensis TaxID=400092 RepID=A0A0E3ZFR8_9BACT|nr:hypothetical protein [Pontibacter korlensis]AKD03628.1 hypothetical protein PKOR_11450 [Pontibacter korlensis]
MKPSIGDLQVVIFYALGAVFLQFSLNHGWSAPEANTSDQYILAAFFGAGMVWLLFELFRFINSAQSLSDLFPLLINLVGLGLCVGYLMHVEEGRAEPLMSQPKDVDTVTISGDTLLGIQKGDTIFYRIGDKVLIDKKAVQKK